MPLQPPPNDYFPHRVLFQLFYWQKASGKEIVDGSVELHDFFPLSGSDGTPSTTPTMGDGVRGHMYDLRCTWVPVDWLTVLNKFSLSMLTYLIFYVALDFMLILMTMLVWAVFRGCTKMASPPRLHFLTWLKVDIAQRSIA